VRRWVGLIVIIASFVMVSGCSSSTLNYNAKIEELDIGSDRIYFARETIDGDKLKIYSIKLNGTGEQFEQLTSSSNWEPKAMKGTIFESMNTFKGRLASPDKKSELIANAEAKWLPNSKGIIIVSNAKVGIYEIGTANYAFLTEGWMVAVGK